MDTRAQASKRGRDAGDAVAGCQMVSDELDHQHLAYHFEVRGACIRNLLGKVKRSHLNVSCRCGADAGADAEHRDRKRDKELAEVEKRAAYQLKLITSLVVRLQLAEAKIKEQDVVKVCAACDAACATCCTLLRHPEMIPALFTRSFDSCACL